jgi:Na+/citrate or Na+/malate symporter
MTHHRRQNLMERTIVLILLGVVMGAIGGAAIGFVTGRTPSSASQ